MSSPASGRASRTRHGELQARVLGLIRSGGPTTIRSVHDLLASERPIAYTTVQTVMGRLLDRGLLEREFKGKVGIYRAVQSEDRDAAGRLVEELVGRFGSLAVEQFVARARLDAAVFDQLRRLVETSHA